MIVSLLNPSLVHLGPSFPIPRYSARLVATFNMDLPVVKGVVTLVPPPEGYDVNFENPKRNGDIACYWLTGVGSLLAILFLGQRLYVKTILRKQFRIDDGELYLRVSCCMKY